MRHSFVAGFLDIRTSSTHVCTCIHTLTRISLFLQADFDRLGLASYSKLRLVRQDQLMLCPTYPLLLLLPNSFPEKDLHAVSFKRNE